MEPERTLLRAWALGSCTSSSNAVARDGRRVQGQRVGVREQPVLNRGRAGGGPPPEDRKEAPLGIGKNLCFSVATEPGKMFSS